MAANPNQFPNTPEPARVDAEILSQFLEAKAENPGYFRELAARKWSDMPTERRDLLTATAADAYPDDLTGREKFINESLVRDYFVEQVEEAKRLNSMFALGEAALSVRDEPPAA